MAGSLTVMVCLAKVLTKYEIVKKMQIYIFLRFISILSLFFSQLYSFANVAVHVEFSWQALAVRLPMIYWWAIALYFCYAIRFSSLKK